MGDSFTLYLCDDCKKTLSSVLTSSSKPITTQMIERIEGVKVESVFDIFDVDKWNILNCKFNIEFSNLFQNNYL